MSFAFNIDSAVNNPRKYEKLSNGKFSVELSKIDDLTLKEYLSLNKEIYLGDEKLSGELDFGEGDVTTLVLFRERLALTYQHKAEDAKAEGKEKEAKQFSELSKQVSKTPLKDLITHEEEVIPYSMMKVIDEFFNDEIQTVLPSDSNSEGKNK